MAECSNKHRAFYELLLASLSASLHSQPDDSWVPMQKIGLTFFQERNYYTVSNVEEVRTRNSYTLLGITRSRVKPVVTGKCLSG